MSSKTHRECYDCGKCRETKVAEAWCDDCMYWSCERGEDCRDMTAVEECIRVFEKYAARHLRPRRSFLARLADSVRGRK